MVRDQILGQLIWIVLQNHSIMKIFSWNVRGAGRKCFCSQVRYLMSKYNSDTFAFMETRSVKIALIRLLKESIANFLFFMKFLLKGFSSGIWLLWKNNIELEANIVKTHARLIFCQLRENKKHVHWPVTFLYG